jgi:hypothetical protein
MNIIKTSGLRRLLRPTLFTAMVGALLLPATGALACDEDFDGGEINAGRYLWFSATLRFQGRHPDAATLLFTQGTVRFELNGKQITLPVPPAIVAIDPSAKLASTVFDHGVWVTVVPPGYDGDVFLAGVAFKAPSDVSRKIRPTRWTGTFTSDKSLSIHWRWSAQVYEDFAATLDELLVKPVDGRTWSCYKNYDPAGTLENYKDFLVETAHSGIKKAVVSAPAVYLPKLFGKQPSGDGSFGGFFEDLSSGNYKIQATFDLTKPQWSTLPTRLTRINGFGYFFDADAKKYHQRFYRLVPQ